MEAEAERLVGLNADGDDYGTPPSSAAKTPSSSSKTVTPYVLQCQPGYHWDFTVKGCVCNCCPTGYTWNGTQCVPPPPPPPPTAYVPTGVITVFDTQLDQGHNTGSSADWPYWRGVRNLNVIARRWFKVDKSYTDVNGHFNVTKNFRNKVKLIVKFKNSNASIRGVRGKRVWQMFYAIRKKIGKYTGSSINSVVYGFGQFPDVSSRGNRYWAGATTLNAVEEHKEYAALFTFSSAPTGMNIFLTNWAKQEGLASTPLFHKRFIQDLPTSFLNTYLVNLAVTYVAGGNAALLAVYARVNVDMAIDYHQPSLSQMTSDGLKETIYHELSHASHYTKVGTGWYTQFVNAELSEIVAHPSKNDPLSPYGSAGTAYAPIIALGEMWAYHMGHFLADQRYGIKGSCQIEQKGAISNCPGGNQHPHIDVLELFNPNFTTDPFYWIPKGLIQDLMDGGIEPASTTVTDNVNGFTILQVFTALQPDVNSIPLYKNRLLLQNNNAQLTQINSLFFSYGY